MGIPHFRHPPTPTYTDLLEGRAPAGYDAGVVDLSFGLRPGSCDDVSCNVVANPASTSFDARPSGRTGGLPPNDNGRQRGLPCDRGSNSPRVGAVGSVGVAASRTRTSGSQPCRSTRPANATDGEGDEEAWSATEVVGRQVWEDQRRHLRQSTTSGITRGVARMNVGEEDTIADNDYGGPEDSGRDDGANDHEEEDEDGEMDICPLRRKREVRSATKKCSEARTRRKGKKAEEDKSAGEGSKSRDFWSVEHMIALVRDKRDQDVVNCVVKAGPRTVVHMPQRNTTMRGRRESGGGEGGKGKRGQGHVANSTKKIVVHNNSDYNEEEGNMAVAVVQGQQMVGRLGFGRDSVPRELVAALKQAGGSAAIVGQVRTPKRGGLLINEGWVAEASPAGGGCGFECRSWCDHPGCWGGAGGEAGGGGEERRVVDVRREDNRGDGRRGSDNDEDNRPSKRLKKHGPEDDLEHRSKLWVDSDAFWGQGPRKPLREAFTDCVDYFIAITNGDSGAEPPSMLIMPPADIQRTKSNDPTQRDPALWRARAVERILMRAIHRWIFKSSSISNGFARAEPYITVDYATDIARSVWQGLEWSRVVSPTLVYCTLQMKMDVPLCFAELKIVDGPEDDDMAAQQEATIIRVADRWTDALHCGQWADDSRLKYDRLSRLADCLRYLVCACMWIIRMGGDDYRSHYDAGYFTALTAKPTLIVAGSYTFNWRRTSSTRRTSYWIAWEATHHTGRVSALHPGMGRLRDGVRSQCGVEECC
ncbi:hypothetical protein CBR_g52594 [Chara braunii]|uniref:Reverse transcriptase domain-containing protein n=1 Tax=Chara braunii TaxID=69332 RepID=A0A388MAH6_CHABU|nr:hypothetical protein CBR_g52594 [Chara braunii]|eukprot:GBG91560.1 hypothetical protein CBR_g52594 [Chara braunii]